MYDYYSTFKFCYRTSCGKLLIFWKQTVKPVENYRSLCVWLQSYSYSSILLEKSAKHSSMYQLWQRSCLLFSSQEIFTYSGCKRKCIPIAASETKGNLVMIKLKILLLILRFAFKFSRAADVFRHSCTERIL